MAKVRSVNRNEKRGQMIARDAEKRAALKAMITDTSLSFEERMDARDKLNKLPRNGSKIRYQTRCKLTGRPHSVYRKFGICRNKLREMASSGLLPGVTKSSW